MNYSPEQDRLWSEVVKAIENDMNPLQFRTWIKPLKLHAVTPDTIVLVGNDPFILGHIKTFHYTTIYNLVKLIFGRSYEIEFCNANDVAKQQSLIENTMLNPKYTFENFVVGSSNNFAYAASLAVAEQPSDVYNPLFIYGDVGLGKTHLMNAIGNYILAENPLANVLFTSSERFTNELIEAIVKKKGTAELRSRMRNVDVLMIDDIQFLSKTNATQEEFFHTFNDLHSKGKQIIISSDRPPKELPTIEERLRSRFEWGLIVDIRKPDFETRVAILRKKADDEYIDIPYDVVEYIASNFDRSIRELEGALTRVYAQSKLMDDPITMELARSTLASLVPSQNARAITPELIIDTIANQYGVEQDDLLSKKRTKEIALPRQIAIYLCRELTSLSTTNIGRSFGNRDHTTVMHSCEKIVEMTKADFSFKKRVEELASLIRNS